MVSVIALRNYKRCSLSRCLITTNFGSECPLCANECLQERSNPSLKLRIVENKLELGWLLDRDIAGLRPAQDLVNQLNGAPKQSRKVRS